MAQQVSGGLQIMGPGPADVTIDVSSGPYESGFKFNTLPFGGMTIFTGNAVRIGSAASINLVPATGSGIVLGTTLASGYTPPTASAAYDGTLFFIPGGASQADTLQICMMSATGTYSWKTIVTG